MVVFEFANSFFYPVCVIAVLVQLGGVIIHTKPEAKRHGAGGGAGGGMLCSHRKRALLQQRRSLWHCTPGWIPLCALPGASANFLASLSTPTVKSLSTYPIPVVGTDNHFLLIKAPSSSRALVSPAPLWMMSMLSGAESFCFVFCWWLTTLSTFDNAPLEK